MFTRTTKIKSFIRSLIYLPILLLVIFDPLLGQQTGSANQDDTQLAPNYSGFSKLNLPGNTNFFYIDNLGLKLATQAIPYETSINEDTYKLGPNDIITVDVGGSQSILFRGLVVNSQGEVVVPTLGNVAVSGLTIDSTESLLKQQFNNIYQSVIIDITLDQPRMPQVHVGGNIPNPGRYTFPVQTRVSEVVKSILLDQTSQNTLSSKKVEEMGDLSTTKQGVVSSTSNQTQNSGKDKENGSTTNEITSNMRQRESYLDTFNRNYISNTPYSLRNIVIKRRSGKKDTADLISYFSTGNLADNPYIRDGDIIKLHKLSRWSPRLSISGAVTAPLETEFIPKDTLSHLIQMAGGLAPDADSSHVNVYRKFNNNIHKITVRHTNFDEFILKPNDRVIVPTNQSTQNTRTAWIYGEVENPGQYPIVKGETSAHELLKMAGGLTQNALPRAAQLNRGQISDFPESKLKDKKAELDLTLLKRTSIQTLEGLEYLTLETIVSEGRVPINLTHKKQLKQLQIHNGDKLFIPRDRHTIFVFGQVNQPGYYNYTKGTGISSYIEKAGGFALPAQKKEIYVIKAGSRSWFKPENTNIQSGDMIFVNRKPYQQYAEKMRIKLQKKQQRNDTIRLILTGISTLTSFVTTYLILTRN